MVEYGREDSEKKPGIGEWVRELKRTVKEAIQGSPRQGARFAAAGVGTIGRDTGQRWQEKAPFRVSPGIARGAAIATGPIRGLWNFLSKAWTVEQEQARLFQAELARTVWLSIFASLSWFIFQWYPGWEFSSVVYYVVGLLYIVQILRLIFEANKTASGIINMGLLILLIPIGIRYVAYGLRVLISWLPQIPIFFTVIAAIAIPLTMMTTLIPLAKWQKMIITLWYIVWVVSLFIWPTIFNVDPAEQTILETQVAMAKDWGTAAWNVISMPFKGLEREIAIATGDYFTGRVEEGARRDLGVFIEDAGTVTDTYRPGEPVNVFATIKAESLGLDDEMDTGQELTVNVQCYDEDDRRGEIRPDDASSFTVYEYEQRGIDCIFRDMDEGEHEIIIKTDFSFSTSAYTMTYLITQEESRELRRKGNDPLEFYKVPEKRPTATYTAGPIGIDIRSDTTPPLTITEEADGPTYTVKLKNMWNGDLESIREIKISTPNGMKITEVNAKPLQNCTRTNGETVCNVDPEVLADMDTEEELITLRAFTFIEDRDELMENAPFAAKLIKVTTAYDYSIKKDIEIEVEEVEV